ncbi:MAG: glycine--tRNA ligase subunit beta [Burkholderiales bacterium]|nr:glycine--tRNA ligase subunit beta [Burkholderiales bacterium]MBP9767950.1 glycine--tRNA ligase subunit beta [Burkholderiales bacterium]
MSALTNENSLLIEFLSEELPPINLVENIGCAFSQAVYAQLNGFVSATSQLRTFIAPRRFGCVIEGISFEQASQQMLRKGPALATGLKDGQATPALLGFAKSCGCEWQDLQQRDDGYFYFAAMIQGKSLDSVIENVINTALKKIHIAKAMRWGNSDYQFVRPVHNLIVKFNQQVLNCSALGLTANDTTLGHRFMSHAPIKIAHAADYLSQIYTEGKVVAEFNTRRDVIEQQLNARAADLGLQISVMPGLLDEVCALVEWPEVLVGEFDEKFLAVPQECLILSMAKNQKYFALVDATGKLSNKFLFVANLISKNPQIIIEGNQKVLTARLADAEFFYEFDKRTPLKDFTAKMGSVVYHNKLGSQLERVQRLQQIAQAIAPLLGVDANLAFTTAYLLKADLASEMVGEFPELQGTMGKYYALASGETAEIANAIEQHYYPRFSGDELPNSALATVMSLADKLESLVGIWGIGLIPTGDKDPYALRRAALGIVRILLEYKLDLEQLLVASFSAFMGKNLAPDTVCGVYEFIKQRLANYFISVENYSAKVVNAVLMQDKIDFAQVVNVCQAFSLWASADANQALFEANKRIENILKKNSAELDASVVLSSNLFNAYEIELFAAVNKINPASSVQVYLEQLSELADPLTKFFANVMVMDEDLVVRKNRLKLLAEIYAKFNIYGKISELA